jgi:hypothetical protein
VGEVRQSLGGEKNGGVLIIRRACTERYGPGKSRLGQEEYILAGAKGGVCLVMTEESQWSHRQTRELSRAAPARQDQPKMFAERRPSFTSDHTRLP